jgi:hypothetical protein
MPVQLLLDKTGMARYAHYERDMTDISTNTEMLSLIDEINAD